MARISNPILFSAAFGVDPAELKKSGLIDTYVNVDTQLFIDPILLEKSSQSLISNNAYTAFKTHFSNFIRLIKISQNTGDTPWRAAKNLLDLSEPPENGLGYGGSGTSGSSRPEEIRQCIMKTSSEIVKLGSQDPEMISLMGFFEEGVGPDTISDFTTRVIIEQLSQITSEFCNANKVKVYKNNITRNFKLPKITTNGKDKFFVLVPSDIVRDLPVANDWSDIESAAYKSARIRNSVNSMLASIATPTVADRKDALKAVATQSADFFNYFIQVVKEHTEAYDSNIDALGYYTLANRLSQNFHQFKTSKSYDIHLTPDNLKLLVLDIIEEFKHQIEKGNLWELLWVDDKPKKERAAQLLFFAIADSFCKANNIDISPEANMGGGPVDFKFSKGYNARLVVEFKRCSGTVVHGYTKQLEIYKDASRTNIGIFVIMNYGKMGKKLAQIKSTQKLKLDAGENASDIIVIDCKKKLSASVRKS